jgi:hypothetical protein
MRKKYLSALLFGALLFASAGTFTSCKDYDDDINNLSQRVDQIASDLADLETKVNALGCVESIEFSDGKLIVHTPNGDVSAAMPECTGIKEVKLEGNTLYVDGVEAGKVELGSGEEGQIPVITVKDGKLYVNDQLMDIEVGSNVVLVDNGDTCTITVDGQSVTLMKNAAQLTSVVIENLEEADFKGTEGFDIQWGIASVATPNWAGEKGAVALDQFLVGQISTVNVQVTPADYDLGAQKLTLVDARGNEAPVIVTAEPNNRLMHKTRTASANGSWILSIAMDETINKTNIEKAFDYDPESTDDIQMAYTLCVNGKPYTTYDLAVVTSSNQYTSGRIANITAARVYFVDEAGREKRASEDKIPAGTTTALTLKNPGLYDYYYTFEGTNKSLAEQYGIAISEDGKSIIVPEGAEGVTITLTAHTMSVTGNVCPNAQETIGQYYNQVTINIAGSEIAAEELNVTTHQVKPGDATKEIRVDFTKDGKSIFASFPAANREEARQNGQVVLKEEATQLGFLTKSNSDYEFQNVHYFKANGSTWNVQRDDLLDLSYMTLDVNGNIADDAKPGNYTLSFVVTDAKVTVPVNITKPAFADVFEKDENWTNDVYEARIYIKGMNAYLRYIDAYKVKSEYQTKADASKLNVVFNALDEFGNYPVLGAFKEFVTDNSKAALVPISSDILLNEPEIYNDDRDGLEVSQLEGMYTYYNVFEGVSVTPETQKAFTIVSESFKTQIKTALDGVTAAVYQNGNVLSNVTVGADGAIAIGTLKNNKPDNGFFFELNDDELAVSRLNFANTQDSDANDKLDIFTLYNNTRPIRDNQVQVKFEGTNGESASWDTTTNNLIFKPAAESSTLRITFEDATGMKYVRDIKVQKVQ